MDTQSRASCPRLRALAATLFAASLGSLGCSVDTREDVIVVPGPGGDPNAVFEVIDTDVLLDTELGMGAGLFVEYESGGLWRLWTSCDTLTSDHVCQFDTFVLSDGFIEEVVELDDMEAGDEVDFLSDFEIRFLAETTVDSDTIEILTEPGAPLELDPFLDGFSAPDFLVWSSGGEVIHGAPRAPVVFTPDFP